MSAWKGTPQEHLDWNMMGARHEHSVVLTTSNLGLPLQAAVSSELMQKYVSCSGCYHSNNLKYSRQAAATEDIDFRG